MYSGSKQLQQTLPKKEKSSWWPVILVMIPVAIVYCAAIFGYAYRNNTADPKNYNSFYLSDFLIASTLILPYLAGWALGMKAALNIANYKRQVKGVLYRSALSRFVGGILIIISFAVVLQLMVALSTYLSHIGLGGILVFVYLIVLVYSIGFLVLASGAKKLKAIERVKVK